MLSPFPGMDPYLEYPPSWPNFHNELITEIRAELNRQLRPAYVAAIEDRVYISDENDPASRFVVPDVHLTYRRTTASRFGTRTAGGAAVIEPVDVTTSVYDEVREPYIEIFDLQNRRVVTVIEVLSPTNKLKGSYGRESYESKRRAVLASTTHLIEIDLLRTGQRMFIREETPPFDYLVHVARVGESERRAKIWPILLASPLPVIPVPLKHNDADSHLDLQQLLASAYERGAFDLRIDYALDPVPPLTAEQADWARSLISKQIQHG